jgi:hypothetical protein
MQINVGTLKYNCMYVARIIRARMHAFFGWFVDGLFAPRTYIHIWGASGRLESTYPRIRILERWARLEFLAEPNPARPPTISHTSKDIVGKQESGKFL